MAEGDAAVLRQADDRLRPEKAEFGADAPFRRRRRGKLQRKDAAVHSAAEGGIADRLPCRVGDIAREAVFLSLALAGIIGERRQSLRDAFADAGKFRFEKRFQLCDAVAQLLGEEFVALALGMIAQPVVLLAQLGKGRADLHFPMDNGFHL